MKDRVLWLGNAEHCRALIGIYSGRIASFYTGRSNGGFLEKHIGEFSAAVLVPDSGRFPDADIFREIMYFSGKHRLPLLFIGSRRQFYAVSEICPDALLYYADEGKLTDGLKVARRRASADDYTVVVFSDSCLYFVCCDEAAELNGSERTRPILCRYDPKNLLLLTERRIKPSLLVLCEDVLHELNTIKEIFPDTPFIVLKFSDEPLSVQDAQPLAVVDAGNGIEELARFFSGAERSFV